jgi:hypothetical protein
VILPVRTEIICHQGQDRPHKDKNTKIPIGAELGETKSRYTHKIIFIGHSYVESHLD